MKTRKQYREMRKADKAKKRALDKEYGLYPVITKENKRRIVIVAALVIAWLIVWNNAGLI